MLKNKIDAAKIGNQISILLREAVGKKGKKMGLNNFEDWLQV